MKITKAQPVTYAKDGPPVREEALGYLNDGNVEIVERIEGNEDYNAIVTLHMQDQEWDFLAQVEE